MIEIRLHGRGGQGAVTAANILAAAAFEGGKQSQAFPAFGVERRGAPVESYVRISEKQIHLRSQIYEPDMLIVLDPSLLKEESIFRGLKKGGLIVANTAGGFKRAGHKSICVDATSLANDILGRPITNTAMLGAFAAVSDLIPLKALTNSLGKAFSSSSTQLPDCKEEQGQLKGKILEKNKVLVKKAYEIVKKKVSEVKNG